MAVGVAQGEGVVEVGGLAEVEGAGRCVVAVVGVEEGDYVGDLLGGGVSNELGPSEKGGGTHAKDDVAEEEDVVKGGPVLGELPQRLQGEVA